MTNTPDKDPFNPANINANSDKLRQKVLAKLVPFDSELKKHTGDEQTSLPTPDKPTYHHKECDVAILEDRLDDVCRTCREHLYPTSNKKESFEWKIYHASMRFIEDAVSPQLVGPYANSDDNEAEFMRQDIRIAHYTELLVVLEGVRTDAQELWDKGNLMEDALEISIDQAITQIKEKMK